MSATPESMAGTSETKASPFKLLKSEGKRLLKDGDVRGALAAYENACKIHPDDRLAAKIVKMKEYLEMNDGQEENDDGMVEIGNDFYLYEGIERKLYAYQKEGLLWMWGLYLKKRGGILGDDMGLGKTIQVIAFLSGMFDADLIKSVLLIMPVSLIPNWKKEFEAWAPGIRVYDYHSGAKKEKERSLARVQNRGGVLLTSYGMVQTSAEVFSAQGGRRFVWCYLILDEGHKIKNPTKTTKAVYELPAKHRLVLTGTAIQNNLRELWALYNFAHQGALLGSLSTFRSQYETHINRSREKDATPGERLLGIEISKNLMQKISPFFLRRTKAEVLENKENTEQDKDSLRPKLCFTAKKNDLVVWVYLSEVQKKIYREFLESEEVANILMTKKSPLVQLTILKKICDHPRLLSKRACVQMGMYDDMTSEEIEEFLEKEEGTSMTISDVPDETLLAESGKMTFVLELLVNLKSEGHRTLFFSQSRKILDIIQRILCNRGFKVTRLDGTITKLCERDRLVTQFQTKSLADIFLLTTQVGGVGLTLTSADRVVIYDPSWNPATDAQAVDRAYRIGQQKNVVVYRLVTCSTVEEKIYRRQIFKDSIIKQTTGKQRDPMRYFTKQELRELFTLEDPTHSATQVQLAEMHSRDKRTDHSLDSHIEFLEGRNVFGVSHHDLMFSEETAQDGPEEFVPGEKEHIRMRVEIANRMVTSEADFVMDEIQNKESYTVPLNIAVKTRQPVPYQQTRPNLFPIVVPDEDSADTEGVKKVTVDLDEDDEPIDIDSLHSINKSLANLTVHGCGSNQGNSIIVEDSEEELFPEKSDQDDSIIIESDEEELDPGPLGSANAEVKVGGADVKVEQKPPCETTDTCKSEPDNKEAVRSSLSLLKVKQERDKEVVRSPVSFLKVKEERRSFKSASEDGSFFSPLRNAAESRKNDGDVKSSRLLATHQSFVDCSASSPVVVPKKEFCSTKGSPAGESFVSCTTSTIKVSGVKQEGPADSNSGQPMADSVRRHLFFGGDQDEESAAQPSFKASSVIEEKRHLKKRLRDSPVPFSPVPSGPKHLLLSPSAEQASPYAKQNFWSPKFKSSPLVDTPSPSKSSVECRNPAAFSCGSPSTTPSKRIVPVLLGTPRRQRRSSMLKPTASPFQKALAESRELSPEESPAKVSQNEQRSVLHSQSVHEISSSEDEGTDNEGGPSSEPHSKLVERSVHTLSSSDDEVSDGSEDGGHKKVDSSLMSEDGVVAVRSRRRAQRISSDNDSTSHSAALPKPAISDTDDELITDDEEKGWESISCSISPRKNYSDSE
ncbi:unnamed protein product [Ixodes hexagonus]